MPPAARLIVLGLLFALLGAAPAAAADSSSPDAPTCDRAWFGPALDIETDTPTAYAERLGATPSLYTFALDYPLAEEGVDQLRVFASDAAAQGAVLVVQVEPTVPLGRLAAADADELTAVLADLHAPLDTDGDGRLRAGDDPYAPYYPGDDAVDWVGLFLYRFGQSQGVRRNVLPPPGEVTDRLAERWGYGEGAPAPFYDRFAEGRGKPLLLETSALYNPAVGGAGERALKQRWWREMLDATETHPRICAISWLELDRVEPEVADQPVDWSATRTPQLASRLLRDLRAAQVVLGTVTEQHEVSSAPPGDSPAPDELAVERPPASALLPDVVPGDGGQTGERAAALVLVALLGLALAGTRIARCVVRPVRPGPAPVRLPTARLGRPGVPVPRDGHLAAAPAGAVRRAGRPFPARRGTAAPRLVVGGAARLVGRLRTGPGHRRRAASRPVGAGRTAAGLAGAVRAWRRARPAPAGRGRVPASSLGISRRRSRRAVRRRPALDGVAHPGADAELPLGRLLVVAVTALAVLIVLTTCWRPASLAAPALLPLGRAPLLVVLAHAVLVLGVASVSSLATGPWVGTAVTVACLAGLVAMARWRDPARAASSRRPAPSAAAPPASRAR